MVHSNDLIINSHLNLRIKGGESNIFFYFNYFFFLLKGVKKYNIGIHIVPSKYF